MTSGSTDFTLTAREVIAYALRKLRVLDPNESMESADSTTAMTELNMMLKGWQKYPSLWRQTEGTIYLTADTTDYQLVPAPHRITNVRYYNGTSEIGLGDALARERYYGISYRGTAGTPTQFYVDYQQSAATLYIAQPLASVTTQEIRYTYQRKFDDVDGLDDEIDVKQEWLEVVGYNLAARLADDYGRTGEVVNRILARAEQLLEQALDDDREDEVRFEPAYAYSWWAA